MKRKWISLLLVSVPFCLLGQTVQVTDHEIHFTVSDRNGQFVTNLNSNNFRLYDNDVRQNILVFDKKLQSPVQLAVLIDRSSSVSERFAYMQEAAVAFINSVIRESEDEGMVVAFDSRVYVLQEWTSSPAAMIHGIRTLSSAGGTSVLDAVYKTCRDKFVATDNRQKVVVLITDGEDTTSSATFEQTLAMAKLSNVVVYVVGVRAESALNTRELQGRKVLTNLADLTGGRIFYPRDTREQLAGLFQTLQTELRNEYSLVYDVAGQPDNTFHTVRIEALDKGLRVHAPTGYYFRKALTLP